MRRRFPRISAPFVVAVVAAALITAFFQPFPPLHEAVRSLEWTLLIEGFVLSVIFLATLEWMEGSEIEFEISTSGIRFGRKGGDDADKLRDELIEMKRELERYRRIVDQLSQEPSLPNGGSSSTLKDEGEDV